MQNNGSTAVLLDEQAIIDALNEWRAADNSLPMEVIVDPEKDHVIWLVAPWRRQQVVLSEAWDPAKLISLRAKFHQRSKG